MWYILTLYILKQKKTGNLSVFKKSTKTDLNGIKSYVSNLKNFKECKVCKGFVTFQTMPFIYIMLDR